VPAPRGGSLSIDVLAALGAMLAGIAAVMALAWSVVDRRAATRPFLHVFMAMGDRGRERHLRLANLSDQYAFEASFSLRNVVIQQVGQQISATVAAGEDDQARPQATGSDRFTVGTIRPRFDEPASEMDGQVIATAHRVLRRRVKALSAEHGPVLLRGDLIVVYRGGLRGETYRDSYALVARIDVGRLDDLGQPAERITPLVARLRSRRTFWDAVSTRHLRRMVQTRK
jgi:hypothetical protein